MNILQHLASALRKAVPAVFNSTMILVQRAQDESQKSPTGAMKHDWVTNQILTRFKTQFDHLGPLAQSVVKIIVEAAYVEVKHRFPELFAVVTDGAGAATTTPAPAPAPVTAPQPATPFASLFSVAEPAPAPVTPAAGER